MKDWARALILLYSLAEQTFRYGYYCLPHPLPPWGKGKGKREGEREGKGKGKGKREREGGLGGGVV